MRENNIVEEVISLYKQKDWRTIIRTYYNHPDRNKLLWVFPTEENFEFIANCMIELQCDRIVSIGCGSGLLEWMITEATGEFLAKRFFYRRYFLNFVCVNIMLYPKILIKLNTINLFVKYCFVICSNGFIKILLILL